MTINSTPTPSFDVLEVVVDDEHTRALSAARAAAQRLEDARFAEFRQARHHRLMLWIAAGVIAGTFLLEVRPDQRVAVRGFGSFPLPELCGSKVVWGFECPACGLTRSFIRAGRGEWLRSLEANRVGFLMMLAVVGQIPYRLAMLGRFRRREPTDARWPKLVAWLIIAALVVNWGLKISGF